MNRVTDAAGGQPDRAMERPNERPIERPAERPVVGVGVVVWRDGRVLLIRRGKSPMRGRWSLPGGRQELGETVREAAVREVREETGLEIRLGALLDVVDTMRRDESGAVTLHYTLIDFDADWIAGEPQAASDAEQAEWADAESLAPYNLWSETLRIVALSQEWRAVRPQQRPQWRPQWRLQWRPESRPG